MKFKMHGKKMLVELPEKDTVSEGGIIIPEGAETRKDDIKKALALVLEVGDKVENIVPGDYVFSDPYMEYLIIKHPITGRDIAFMSQDNVLSTITL